MWGGPISEDFHITPFLARRGCNIFLFPTFFSPSPFFFATLWLTYLQSRDGASESAPSPSPPSSLTHAHRCVGSRNPNWHTWPNSGRLTYLSVYDRRDVVSDLSTSRPPPPHSHMYTVYNSKLSPRPHSSLSCTLRSFGVLRV